MQITGEWLLCDDGMTRPILRGDVETADGNWESALFLLDTGADRTVLCAAVLALLDIPPADISTRIGGVGGVVESVVISTRIRFPRDGGGVVAFRGHYAACTKPESLDISILGRDLMDHFVVIVDRPGGMIALLSQRHRYAIFEQHA